MNPRIKEFISLAIVALFALLILKNIYFNLATFDKLTYFDGRIENSVVQSIATPPEPINKNINDNINRVEFPKDEGQHQNLQTEWWYFAGHLEDEKNPANKFGLTLIFDKNPAQIKFSLSDEVSQTNFSSVINFDQYDILAQDKLAIKKDDIYWLEQESAKYKMNFKWAGKEANLDLISLKSPWFLSNNEEKFYYQQSRLAVSGYLSFSPGEQYKVQGSGWIDHQGFKSSLPWKSWRWYSLQLNNQTEMAFVTDFTSKSGNFSQKNNLYIFKKQMEIVDSQKYEIKDLAYWQNPENNISYPIRWQLDIPERDTKLIISAVIPDQVIDGTNGFYEGTCQVEGIFEGQPVSGRAQFEYQPLIKN